MSDIEKECKNCGIFHDDDDEFCQSPASICSPIRISFTFEEMAEKLKDWMVREMGIPKELDEEDQNKWFETNGRIYAFLHDSFSSNA